MSGEGTWVLGTAAASLVAASLVQRWVAGRKQVYYRVQSDSKIGLDVNLHDADDGDGHADEELIAVAKVVNSLSFVVIRIRNTGGDVALSDPGDEPVEFTFHGRVIWNARISDASVPDHREKLIDSLEFFSTDTDTPGAPVIRCERDTEAQQIDEVASTPGAIGYLDVPLVHDGLTALALDGERPSVSGISAGYPFWTIEYLYTKGVPAADTLLAAFICAGRAPARP